MALTVKQIEALRPESKRYEVPDGDGLILRVSPSGKKSFCFVYRIGNKVKRLTIGVFPEMSLAQARQEASKARSSKARGEDPVEAKKWAQETWKSTPTVAEFIDEYMQRWAKPNKKSWQEDQRLLDKDVKPIIGDKKITEVRRRDIIHVLDLVKDRGSMVTANRTFAVISRMFNFALERGVLEASPATRIKMEAEESRDRVLTWPEIKTLHQLLNDQPLWISTRMALEMILRTAQRPGEVRQMSTDEIDFDQKLWTIPKDRTKNGIAQRVPLTDEVLSMIKVARSFSSSKWIFPSPQTSGPLSTYALAQGLRRATKDSGLPRTTPHDLRRTAATIISELGFNRLVVDKILNHKDRTVGGIYDRHTYDAEKRQALEAWEAELEQILAGKLDKGGKVIDIRKAQG
ncbi:MAG: tyrosine-type recombinase/integrase [Desulfovermiculus sp.]|nr:tyrosine-type recombinase/integrase [Desulfovermiculus sp.]